MTSLFIQKTEALPQILNTKLLLAGSLQLGFVKHKLEQLLFSSPPSHTNHLISSLSLYACLTLSLLPTVVVAKV